MILSEELSMLENTNSAISNLSNSIIDYDNNDHIFYIDYIYYINDSNGYSCRITFSVQRYTINKVPILVI